MPLDQGRQPLDGQCIGFEAEASLGSIATFRGMPCQPALDITEPVGQHDLTLPQPGSADVEVSADLGQFVATHVQAPPVCGCLCEPPGCRGGTSLELRKARFELGHLDLVPFEPVG
jgi:hypothetical protein